MSGGELSVDVSRVEEQLTSVFNLGKRWKAVVLLDEADVVMAKRSSEELERNAIVAGELTTQPRVPYGLFALGYLR